MVQVDVIYLVGRGAAAEGRGWLVASSQRGGCGGFLPLTNQTKSGIRQTRAVSCELYLSVSLKGGFIFFFLMAE